MGMMRNGKWKHHWNKITTRITDKENIYEILYATFIEYILFTPQ